MNAKRSRRKRQTEPADPAAELRAAIAQAEAAGTSRYAIAKAAGVDQSQVRRVATGEVVPKLDTAAKIARAIGYRLTVLPAD